MNYGNDKYNPGYCGIFGIIAMTFYRGVAPPNGATTFDRPDDHEGAETPSITPNRRRGAETPWLKKWNQLLKYMRQRIPDEPDSHGCMGTNLAARVQEIIASHPSTTTGHQNIEKEITQLLKEALKRGSASQRR